MAATPLNAMTTNATKSLNEEDLTAALFVTNTQANTNPTMENIKAALGMTNVSASTIDEHAASIHESNNDPVPTNGPDNEIDGQRQQRRNCLAEYQRRQVAVQGHQPKGHRRMEYRSFLDEETDSHREERLGKKRERNRAKRAEAKEAQERECVCSCGFLNPMGLVRLLFFLR